MSLDKNISINFISKKVEGQIKTQHFMNKSFLKVAN